MLTETQTRFAVPGERRGQKPMAGIVPASTASIEFITPPPFATATQFTPSVSDTAGFRFGPANKYPSRTDPDRQFLIGTRTETKNAVTCLKFKQLTFSNRYGFARFFRCKSASLARLTVAQGSPRMNIRADKIFARTVKDHV